MNRKIFQCAVCCGLLLTAGMGCQNTVNRVENANQEMTPNIIKDKRFITDGWLRDRLQLTRLQESETPDGLKMVQLTAVNVRTGALAQLWSGMQGDNPYRVKYLFRWFDKAGMERKSILSTWQEILVKPGEAVYLQSVAPDRDCRDFTVSLQEAN